MTSMSDTAFFLKKGRKKKKEADTSSIVFLHSFV